MNKVAVVVPYYKNELSDAERSSLKQVVRVLSNYDIFLVCPQHLCLDTVLREYPVLKAERFEDNFFADIRGYNRLMLSEAFYLRFSSYDYILIYQLDAYIFKDELQTWVDKGYDYIGAPWFPSSSRYDGKKGKLMLNVKRFWHRLIGSKELTKYCYFEVGNGGFCLRKVDKMLQITRAYREKIACKLSDDALFFYPEDLFLLFEVTSPKYRLKKPSYSEAARFALETNPQKGIRLIDVKRGGVLPMGCHAWEKDKEFWEKFIKSSSD